jgi:hypothetical protein
MLSLINKRIFENFRFEKENLYRKIKIPCNKEIEIDISVSEQLLANYEYVHDIKKLEFESEENKFF